MKIGEPATFLRQPIKVRRAGMFGAVAAEIAEADIVGKYEYDIRSTRNSC